MLFASFCPPKNWQRFGPPKVVFGLRLLNPFRHMKAIRSMANSGRFFEAVKRFQLLPVAPAGAVAGAYSR